MTKISFKTLKLNRETKEFGHLELNIAVHPLYKKNVILNFPGLSEDINGFNNRYELIANMLQEANIGAVVRAGNEHNAVLPYPESMVDNFRFVLDYTLSNARNFCGFDKPSVYLMGFSAGASVIAAIASEYSQVEKILLFAPSADAGMDVVRIGDFKGDIGIVVAERDWVVGKRVGEAFYRWATNARSRSLFEIANCDHWFSSETNNRIMCELPASYFVQN